MKTTIYCYIDYNNKPIYIGKSDYGFEHRFRTHTFSNTVFLKTKTVLVLEADLIVEKKLISFYQPKLNKNHLKEKLLWSDIETISDLVWYDYDKKNEFLINDIPFAIFSCIEKIDFKNKETTNKIAYLTVKGFKNWLPESINQLKHERQVEENKHEKYLNSLKPDIIYFNFKVNNEIQKKYLKFKKQKGYKTASKELGLFFDRVLDKFLNLEDLEIYLQNKAEKSIRASELVSIGGQMSHKKVVMFKERIKTLSPSKRRICMNILFLELL